MAVAMGESVANMLQPFFALPILAIAGIKMRRMMGFMVITFLISFLVFGASLLFLCRGVRLNLRVPGPHGAGRPAAGWVPGASMERFFIFSSGLPLPGRTKVLGGAGRALGASAWCCAKGFLLE